MVPKRQQPNPLVTRLGERLRELRRERGYSLEQMTWGAELSGKGYLSQAERGQALPTVTTLSRIANCLGVELVDLLNFPEVNSRSALLDATRGLGDREIKKLLRQATELRATMPPPEPPPPPQPPSGYVQRTKKRLPPENK